MSLGAATIASAPTAHECLALTVTSPMRANGLISATISFLRIAGIEDQFINAHAVRVALRVLAQPGVHREVQGTRVQEKFF